MVLAADTRENYERWLREEPDPANLLKMFARLP